LIGAAFGFLKTEHVRFFRVEKFKKIFLQHGAQTIDVPGNQFHDAEITENHAGTQTNTLALTATARATSLPGITMIANAATNKPAATPNFRVSDERLVKLTANAARKVASLLTKQGRPNGVLRVAVVGGGCSGLQYKMDLQDAPANRDFLVETAGVHVVVDPKSALYVTGSELDYADALEGGFKVKNPNAATSCSCGESFSA
jgi:iron-sulfur cluster assembly protein